MITAYLLLFGSAFLAATILPFYSEVILFALLREGGDPTLLVVVATLGTTLARRCAEAGADLVLAARTADRLDEVAKEVTALGRRAVSVTTTGPPGAS